MEVDMQNARWWDWLFSPPAVGAFYLAVDLATSFVADPQQERSIITYARYASFVTLVLWGVFSVKRFGWKEGLPPRVAIFWIVVIFVEFLIWAILQFLGITGTVTV